MKSGTQVALAVGAGYLLGRRHKMRLALVLGGAAMTGKAGGLTGQLLRQSTKLAGSSGVLGKVSPEMGEVTDMVRGELLEAGKAAALTAVRSRVDRVSDKLRDQAEALRQRGGQGRDEDEAAEERAADTAEEPQDTGEEPEDFGEEPEDTGEEPEDSEEEPQDTGEEPQDFDEEPEDVEEEPEEDEDVGQAPSGDGSGRDSSYERRTTRTRSAPAPVRRTGR